MQKRIALPGIQVGSKSGFEDMNRAMEINDIHPVIDRTYHPDQFATAFQYVDSGKHFAKVVVSF